MESWNSSRVAIVGMKICTGIVLELKRRRRSWEDVVVRVRNEKASSDDASGGAS
jgi:hypothetical protein